MPRAFFLVRRDVKTTNLVRNNCEINLMVLGLEDEDPISKYEKFTSLFFRRNKGQGHSKESVVRSAKKK